MNIKVRPAKRLGVEKIILSQPLELVEMDVDGDDIKLGFCGGGLYDDKSQYRYTMQFSRSEMLELLTGAGAH